MTTLTIPAAGPLTADEAAELAACALSFRRFLRHWQFIDREHGAPCSFRDLWQGQAQLAELMERHPWLYALKAGKLGFSELACAYDGWVARFRPNARVHLFSRNLQAARALLGWVRYGLEHLPPYMRLPVGDGVADGNNSTSLKLIAGPDDVRTVVSYPATAHVAIDQTATHTHLDEFARQPGGGETVWRSVETTVAPGGSLHIVTRGAGPNFAARLWRQALSGESRLHPFFAPWDARPGRDARWYQQELREHGETAGLWQYAPTTWQEAIQGDDTYVYPMFDSPPGRHVKHADPCDLEDCPRVAVGIDLGAVTPTAMALVGERSSGRAHVYAEYYVVGSSLDRVEAQLQEWEQWAGRKVRVFVPPDEKLLLATLREHGFDAWRAMTELKAGIQLVRERLVTDGLTVHAECRHLRDEFADYRATVTADQTTRVEYAGERPIKHHCDLLDALRYAVAGLAQWQDVQPVMLPDGRVYAG
ncbi:MAG TPA: hypothetical protein VNM91_09025 [Dehalococcoidia bacterium]|nr:hypothetical protein [Dehalococcoidia bacterium]